MDEKLDPIVYIYIYFFICEWPNHADDLEYEFK